MRCPRCARENPARAKFCLECGACVPVGCAGCGAALVDGAKFCVECGRPVAAVAPEVAAEPGARGGPGAVEAKSPEGTRIP